MSEEQKNSIKINRKKLSSQQVRARENFGIIIDNHRKLTKRPIYKQKRFYFFLFLVLVVSYLMYYTDKQHQEKESPKTEQIN